MKLYEYLAKEVFARRGIPVPRGGVASTPEEAEARAREVGGPVAVKSQVLAGGRGKAGGITFADTPAQAREAAERLLGTELKGLTIEKVLVEEKLAIRHEIYLGVAIDRSARRPLIIASAKGGINIEEIPEEDIVRRTVDVAVGVEPFVGREIVRRLGLDQAVGKQVADILARLYKVFRANDAELTEINPLVVVEGGRVIAADGRLNVDDEALYRHKELPYVEERTGLEKKIHDLGVSYVALEGDIAVIANGAGITMGTLDTLMYYGGRPANFLDAGGGTGSDEMAAAISLLLETGPSAFLVNIFGGITRCDEVAKALIQARQASGADVPFVIRLVGTNEAEGHRILRENGMEAFRSMAEAAQKVVALASSRASAAS
ncbi:MAG: ADP-forming succinate--CoA ligase subunit beta [Firmicutes bacterium]|nr:ADP-forming succinate--CoA ligase subunit beta [Bacillota bacterium]